MAVMTILAEQTLDGFALDESFGAFMFDVYPAPFTLELGESYSVEWDGNPHICEVQDFSEVFGEGCVGLGNLAVIGGSGNNEPFAIGCMPVGVSFLSTDNKTSHTVAIYQDVEDDMILEETTLEGFDESGELLISPAIVELMMGETYRVVWNEIKFVCVAAAFDGTVYIGNRVITGADATDIPFAIAYIPAEVTGSTAINVFQVSDGATSCKMTVYRGDEIDDSGDTENPPPEDPEEPEENLEGIILKNRNGNDVAYYGIETVTFDTTTEGKQQTFTKGIAVEGFEIVPDFSGGDVAVTAPDGTLVKSAVIKKPGNEEITVGESEGAISLDFTNDYLEITPSAVDKFLTNVIIERPEALVPENVAEGVNIGGILGKFKGGGAKVAIGTAYSSSGTVTHNLMIGITSSGMNGRLVLNFLFLRNTEGPTVQTSNHC